MSIQEIQAEIAECVEEAVAHLRQAYEAAQSLPQDDPTKEDLQIIIRQLEGM